MSTEEFWGIVVIVGAFLWWLSYVATARMRHGKNKEREEQARRNLEWLAKQQAEEATSEQESQQKEGS
ncbi:hypothetical protein Ga0123462_1700 [Mariprofundus ferrinatatus]|uniref:CcmD family protein n=1 Tax=Mariprofundus ferrinatatus TaxID=1921087 RepID=A0A2K8L8I7_9PROT|nr:hypothetical protein [Mariprofundus ferrinatatus]ATX82549.1 hypothetical protein Ga0123462_1700 [Mariprofundus ferrinatatus]